MQSVIFRIGEKAYAVDALSVQEILKTPVTTPLPQAPAFVLGVTEFRGKGIPVVHLGQVLGVAGAMPGNRAIVLDSDELCAAFLVDDVSDVREIPDEALDEMHQSVSTEHSVHRAVARVKGEIIIVVDPIKLLIKSQ